MNENVSKPLSGAVHDTAGFTEQDDQSTAVQPLLGLTKQGAAGQSQGTSKPLKCILLGLCLCTKFTCMSFNASLEVRLPARRHGEVSLNETLEPEWLPCNFTAAHCSFGGLK